MNADSVPQRVDAHHHVWSLARGDYDWLTPRLAPIYRDFTLDDLRPELRAARIDATVLVQAAPTVAETEYLLGIARNSGGVVRGVVGWVDLGATDAVATLERLACDPLLRSIRPMLHDLPEADWILRPAVTSALRALPELGLRFDALVRPRELPALLRLLERESELAVVIDHGAKPDIAPRAWQPWADLIATAASHPGVCCKLSGLAIEAEPGWTAGSLRRYVEHLIACFGAERLLWGSDWPVVNLAGGYARWLENTDALLAPLTDAERAAIMGENARRFYDLG
jgi:L-fuconolactonase